MAVAILAAAQVSLPLAGILHHWTAHAEPAVQQTGCSGHHGHAPPHTHPHTPGSPTAPDHHDDSDCPTCHVLLAARLAPLLPAPEAINLPAPASHPLLAVSDAEAHINPAMLVRSTRGPPSAA